MRLNYIQDIHKSNGWFHTEFRLQIQPLSKPDPTPKKPTGQTLKKIGSDPQENWILPSRENRVRIRMQFD